MNGQFLKKLYPVGGYFVSGAYKLLVNLVPHFH